MKRLKTRNTLIILVLFLLLLPSVFSFGQTSLYNITTDKSSYALGETITWTANWDDTGSPSMRLLISDDKKFTNCNYLVQTGCLAYSELDTSSPTTASDAFDRVENLNLWYGQICDSTICTRVQTSTLPLLSNFTSHTLTTTYLNPYSINTADINGDGNIDVLIGSGGDEIVWLEGAGDGSFTYHLISTQGDLIQEAHAIDLDDDGDMDIISGSSTDDEIAWLENNGAESFTRHIITTAADSVQSVYPIDLDEDGDMDIISGSTLDSEVAWLENNGAESFTYHIISTAGSQVRSVMPVDLDGDGDIDIVSGSAADDEIAWLENNGAESFTRHIISTAGDFVLDIYPVDLDDDGDMDIVSTSISDDEIAWLENDGSESFTYHIIFNQAGDYYEVFPIDLDSDGDIDIIGANWNGGIDWLENDGSESFTRHILLGNGQARATYAADLDSDGDIDVLGGFQSYNEQWFENTQTSAEGILTENHALTVTLLTPLTNIAVENESWFEIIAEISCIVGDCGYVNVTLDPLILTDTVDYDYTWNYDFGMWSDVGVDTGDWLAWDNGTLAGICTEVTNEGWGDYWEYEIGGMTPAAGDQFNAYPNEGECLSHFDSTSKLGIIPAGLGSPFYTNKSTNPVTINLGTGSQNVTFWVKANVSLLGVYENFFIYVDNLNGTTIPTVESSTFDVTVVPTPGNVTSEMTLSTTSLNQGETFTATVNVTCTSSECNNVEIWLDPVQGSSSNYWIYVLLMMLTSSTILGVVLRKHKSQTATEYMVIVAIVIVIAVVVSSVLGEFPGIGGSIEKRTNAAQLQSQPIGTTAYSIGSEGITLVLQNNIVGSLRIDDIIVEGTSLVSDDLPLTMDVGQSKNLFSSSITGSSGKYDLPYLISYTILDTDASYTLGDNPVLKLIGTYISGGSQGDSELSIPSKSILGNSSTTPFYIIGDEFKSCGNLTLGEKCSHVFTVSATGSGPYQFFEQIREGPLDTVSGTVQTVTIN